MVPVGSDGDSEGQMQLLFAELKRIDRQQQQLKTAVAQNKVLVVHPPKGFDAASVEDEYAEEEEVKPNPDRFIPSGGCACLILDASGDGGLYTLYCWTNSDCVVCAVTPAIWSDMYS